MRFGLEEPIVENIISVLEQNPKVDKSLMFGSRVKGNYRPDSDIDIAIKGKDLNFDDTLSLLRKLDDLEIAYEIDLINYHSIKEPDLKDHIDRLGIELYSRWKEYRFSDFALINPTVSLKGNEEYSFVEMKDLEDGNKICSPSAKRKTSSGARFQERDTLFARITPCLENGKICQVRGLENGIGFGSTEFLVFRGKENISNNDFVFYLSRWNEVRDFAENNFEGTSGRQRVPKNCFDNLKLKLPPFHEQTAIATILSSLDDKIDLLQRQNKTLEQLAETVFRQWFVEEAEESWEKRKLGEIIEIKGGFSYKGEFIGNGNSLLLGMGCVSFDKRFLLTGVRSYSGECPESHLVNPGDLVIATRQQSDSLPILGFPAIIPEEFEGKKVIVGANLYKVKNESELDNYFLYTLFRTSNYRNHILASSKGSTVRMITKDAIESYEFNMPPIELINEYQSIVKSLNDKQIENYKKIRTLTQTRDTLLPKLMSGEVRVNL